MLIVGCHWTESCHSKWLGGCGSGYIIVDQSDDCKGLCPVADYPACLPFHTHFHCCRPGTKVMYPVITQLEPLITALHLIIVEYDFYCLSISNCMKN